MKKQKLSNFDKIDLFASPLPTFNIEGVQKVSSCFGFTSSVTLYLFVVGYVASRLLILFGNANPVISGYTIEGEHTLDHKVDLNEYGFHFAFYVEKFDGGDSWSIVHDPNYVDFVAYINERDETGVQNSTHVGIHKCTKSDISKFYNPKKGQEK
jgi:hypothetical protein